MISKLPCNHLFNTDAILKWLKEEKAECPICRFKLESIEKKSERSDSSNNIQVDRVIRPRNTRFPHPNAGSMHAFRPPRMPRRSHNAHLRRLMLSRHEQDEQEELQAALLASLEDQYMPEHHSSSKSSFFPIFTFSVGNSAAPIMVLFLSSSQLFLDEIS